MDRTANSRTAKARRFLRYCAVGGLGTVVHFGTTMLLVEALRIDAIVATVIGFLCALAVSFVLNRSWVFASTVAVAPGLARYSVVSGLGFVLNVTIMALVTRVLGLDYRIGLALVVLIIPITNFTLNARWTFRH